MVYGQPIIPRLLKLIACCSATHLPCPVQINDFIITKTYCCKFPGPLVGRGLTWNSHVDYICKDTISNCVDRNYYFNIEKQYSPGFQAKYDELNLKEGEFLRLSIKVKVDGKEGKIYHHSSLVCSLNHFTMLCVV